MEVVWPNVADIVAKSDIWIAERTILAPLNTSVNSINTFLLQQVTSEVILMVVGVNVYKIMCDMSYDIE